MTRQRSAGALAALFVLVASCVSSRAPSNQATYFVAAPLSPTVSRIDFSAGNLSAHEGALVALCRCAELALDRGFRYLRVYDRERLGPRRTRWKVQFFHVPPPGADILDVAAPTWEGEPPSDGVLNAISFSAVCRERANARRQAPDADPHR